MGNFLDSVIKKKLSRRKFITASAAGVAALALPGCGNKLASVNAPGAVGNEGKWISAACWHNCGGKCVNKALVVDGVIVRQKTDDTHPDSPEYPQQRSCLRGHAQRQHVLTADRIKYPMKRKHWEPGGGDKSLRGRDTWVRISWDEALDIVASELKKAKEKYGNRSILNFPGSNFLFAWGGASQVWDTSSQGTKAFPWEKLGVLTKGNANDRLDMKNSETIIFLGANPAWSSAGLYSYNFMQAKKAGTKFIYVGPSYNATAAAFDAKWIPIRSGTDVAFLLAVAYVLITEDDPIKNPMLDWDYIKKYTLGFDADTMPPNAKLNENFKDYILGKYDNIPKTPAWGSKICGATEEDIIFFARTIRKDQKVAVYDANAAARCIGAEDYPQLYATIGFMTGHIGKPGHAFGNAYKGESNSVGAKFFKVGSDKLPKVDNPIEDTFCAPVVWKEVLAGKYLFTGKSTFQGSGWTTHEMRDIDIRVVYNQGKCSINIVPGVAYAIEAHRKKLDFVVTHAFAFTTEAQFSDIILPVTTKWEREGDVVNFDREAVIVWSQVMEPLYEAKSDQWIEVELSKRLGIDLKKIYPIDEKQQFFNKIAGTQVILEDAKTYVPLVTITDADIEKWGVQGKPQNGKIGLQEFIDQGVYQIPRHEGDNYGAYGYGDFIKDPEKKPLTSKSGKLDIYSDYKADTLNANGYADMKFKPYPSYTVAPEGYETTFKDWDKQIKGDYPYLASNPHYLRRVHSVLDNVPWLREAASNPVFINRQDAEEKGIKTGDTVLIWNAHGKTLRQASVSDIIMPGMVELPHGRWLDLDEETGIDRAGTDNILCGSVTSNMGVSGYNNYNCNFKKYEGEPLKPDRLVPVQGPKEV